MVDLARRLLPSTSGMIIASALAAAVRSDAAADSAIKTCKKGVSSSIASGIEKAYCEEGSLQKPEQVPCDVFVPSRMPN